MKTLKLYGPPGTGKTRTMLEYFEQELKTVSPDKVAFMTFTRAARLEALARSHRPEEELPWVKTIHAICYKLLKVRQNQLVSKQDLKEFGKKIGMEIRGTLHDPWSLESVTGATAEPTVGDRLLQLNHLGRHRQLHLRETLKHAPSDLDFHTAKWFTESYREWKRANHLLDYTDLLTHYLAEGPRLQPDVVFVDEAQDLSRLQWEVVRKFGGGAARTYLAGDDDQAIFTWAGASPEAFNDEPTDAVHVLDQSYRLPRAVHLVSERIAHRIRGRQDKLFHPRPHDGQFREIGNLGFDCLDDSHSYLLFRNHYRGAALAEQLETLNWPYQGAYSPLDNPEIKLLLKGYRSTLKGHDVNPSEAQSLVLCAHPIFLRGHAEELVERTQKPVGCNAIFAKDVSKVPFHELFRRMVWNVES